MTQLTSEQIIEGMAKAHDGDGWRHMTNAYHQEKIGDMKAAITYLTSIGYQITKIEPDDDMEDEGYEAYLLGGVNDVYKAMSQACRVTLKDENDT